ncbi:MAG TPA: hypothetical protein VND19_07850 [Acetobacteraceae bacterium]|nr:hypothetical protein [Acetobacteraceae bacterium]
MRRTATVALMLTLAMTGPLAAQAAEPPPHAWLFGAWIGGMFPPPVTLSARECLAQPMVIFTRDVVMRAVMTSPAYVQRLIDTARATANGFQVRLLPPRSAADSGFGCPNPDVLPVQRRGDNEIAFPGCTDFPFPLIRCATR